MFGVVFLSNFLYVFTHEEIGVPSQSWWCITIISDLSSG